jgi:hypothetical protein
VTPFLKHKVCKNTYNDALCLDPIYKRQELFS